MKITSYGHHKTFDNEKTHTRWSNIKSPNMTNVKQIKIEN